MFCRVHRGEMTYTIRPMLADDSEEVARLYNDWLPANNQTWAESLEVMLMRQEYQGLVLCRPTPGPGGQVIVGAMMLSVGPGFRWLINLTIERHHRRQGLASAMIDLLKQVAVDYALSINVEVVRQNQAAICLLQARGFHDATKGGPGPVVKMIFCGEIHNDPHKFAWSIEQTQPEYEATEIEEPAAGDALPGV